MFALGMVAAMPKYLTASRRHCILSLTAQRKVDSCPRLRILAIEPYAFDNTLYNDAYSAIDAFWA